MGEALGMIETRGLSGCMIEAADAMVKAIAKVNLVGWGERLDRAT